MTEIELKNISYIYGKDTPFERVALHNVSMTFQSGMITGLIGHTGSGKSTVAQLLNGLLQPSAGQIYVGGINIWAEPKKIRDIRFRVGLVFQYPEYQLFEETVYKDIAFGPVNMGLKADKVRERVMEAAAFAHLREELLEKSPFELSGGQKRRAAIAGVMAMEPEVLVLDEPAAGLDPRGRKKILGGIQAYQRQKKNTVIMISHSMEDMAVYADRLAVMNQGELFFEGSKEEVFSRAEELKAAGLAVPQITELVGRLRQLGVDVPGNIYTVADAYEILLSAYRNAEKVHVEDHPTSK